MNKTYTRCIMLLMLALMHSLNNLAIAAQFCNTAIPATTPDDQLINNGDGTITYTKTGLMWKQQSEKTNTSDDHPGNFSWIDAINRAASSSYAGHTDWRVPNTKELLSLVEWSCAYPAINLHYFPELGEGWVISFDYDAVDMTINQEDLNQDGKLLPTHADMARVNFSSGGVSPGLSYYQDLLRLVRDAN